MSGVLLGAILMCAVIYSYFASGRAPVATSDPELPFESALAGKALRARILREVRGITAAGTPDDLLAGPDFTSATVQFVMGYPPAKSLP